MKRDFVLALHIMGFLTAAQGTALSSQVLADTFGTSAVVVRRLLLKLSRAGLVVSQRGVGGGTVLARDPQHLSLRDVYEAVMDDEVQVLPRYPTDQHGPAMVLGSYINELLVAAEEELLQKLDSISVFAMDAEVRPVICALLRSLKDDKTSS